MLESQPSSTAIVYQPVIEKRTLTIACTQAMIDKDTYLTQSTTCVTMTACVQIDTAAMSRRVSL
jgi:hypothetical protein